MICRCPRPLQLHDKIMALASAGTRATVSGTLRGYQIHQLAWVHDGLYGSTHSWIADSISNAWVCLELPVWIGIRRRVRSLLILKDRVRPQRLFLDPGVFHAPEPVALAVQNIGEGPHARHLGIDRAAFQQRRAHRFGGHVCSLAVDLRPGNPQFGRSTMRTTRQRRPALRADSRTCKIVAADGSRRTFPRLSEC